MKSISILLFALAFKFSCIGQIHDSLYQYFPREVDSVIAILNKHQPDSIIIFKHYLGGQRSAAYIRIVYRQNNQTFQYLFEYYDLTYQSRPFSGLYVPIDSMKTEHTQLSPDSVFAELNKLNITRADSIPKPEYWMSHCPYYTLIVILPTLTLFADEQDHVFKNHPENKWSSFIAALTLTDTARFYAVFKGRKWRKKFGN